MKNICITRDDMDRLRRLIDGWQEGSVKETEHLAKLEEELDRAEIVEKGQVPPDVITMNSEVRLKDLDSGEVRTYKLIYPSSRKTSENAVSILAPVGMALIGYRVGDLIEWPVPRGIRRLVVLEVLYQPERADSADAKNVA